MPYRVKFFHTNHCHSRCFLCHPRESGDPYSYLSSSRKRGRGWQGEWDVKFFHTI